LNSLVSTPSQDVDLCYFVFGVAMAVLLFFPFTGVLGSKPLSTLPTLALMLLPNQNAIHLKKLLRSQVYLILINIVTLW
jgi:hypothetical protein